MAVNEVRIFSTLTLVLGPQLRSQEKVDASLIRKVEEPVCRGCINGLFPIGNLECAHTHTGSAFHGEHVVVRRWLSPSTMWVAGAELDSSGLVCIGILATPPAYEQFSNQVI